MIGYLVFGARKWVFKILCNALHNAAKITFFICLKSKGMQKIILNRKFWNVGKSLFEPFHETLL